MMPTKLKQYNPKYFSKGKRSIIYKFHKNKKQYIIKTKKPGIAAKNPIANEAKFLRLVNNHKIGPKYLSSGKNYVIYEFIKGKFFITWIKTANKKSIKNIIINILKQCRTLDKLKINKKEMHHPVKHIIINKKPVMIDFERCYYTKKPKNVTQFSQFLILINNELIKKGIKISKQKFIQILKEYKKQETEENFKKILKLI